MSERPNRLRELREARGLSLQGLADLVGSNKTVMQRLETGETNLDVAWMKRLASKMGIKPSEILNDEDVEFRAGPSETLLRSALESFEAEERALFLATCTNLTRLMLRTSARRGAVALAGDPEAAGMLADAWNGMREDQRGRALEFIRAASHLSPPALPLAAE